MDLIGYFLIFILIIFIINFSVFRTTKEFPKTWYEWKSEFKFQYIGLIGYSEDLWLRNNNNVVISQQPERIAIITGGNRGIGLRVVEKLLKCDMTVIMGCRNPEEGYKSVSEIVDLSQSRGKLICSKLDVGSMGSVKEFGKKIQRGFEKIDLLINNAGIMCAPFQLTEDGFESHFAINFLGHYLLTHMLLPQLKKAGRKGLNARVINVSSILNMIGKINYKDINGLKNYHPPTAYYQSKLAQILFTKFVNDLMVKEGAHVQLHAVHPGIVDTDLFKHTSTASVPRIKKLLFKTPEEGSRTIVYAAIAPKLEGEGGTYLSNCVFARCNSDVENSEKCEKFYNFSCDLIGIKEYGNGKV